MDAESSSRKRKRHGKQTVDTLSNDFVNLPIIVSDYDALIRPTLNNRDQEAHDARSEPASPSGSIIQQKRETGFAEFADGFWNQMTGRMKQKLRDACFEVLKRTEDPGHQERACWIPDDDARFLD